MGAIAGPAGIAVGLASGAALAKVCMKRSRQEKETRRKELEDREERKEKERAEREEYKREKKEKRKLRGTSMSKEEKVDDVYRTMKE